MAIITSGNTTVDRMAQLNITEGVKINVIPAAWYQTIRRANGKVNLNACVILAEIVYWYRPKITRDPDGRVLSMETRFQEDALQKSYQELADQFGLSKRQVTDAIIFLEQLGVIRREFRTLKIGSGCVLQNVLFLHLDADRLAQLTYPDKKGEVSGYIGTPPSTERDTYTENTTKTNTEITTSYAPAESVDEEMRRIFSDLGLSDADILAIGKAAGHDPEKCRTAVSALRSQSTSVRNIVGWLIDAVRKGYRITPGAEISAKSSHRKTWFDLPQQDIDFDELERRIVVN